MNCRRRTEALRVIPDSLYIVSERKSIPMSFGVRGSLLTAIMILDYDYQMHTYL
jgi:hypothetical protein